MPDKQLTESAWKAFAKGKTYKDEALLKALAALAKAEKAGPDEHLDALADIERQSDLLRRAHKDDKALSAQLQELAKAAERDRKAATQAKLAAEKAEAQAAKGGEDDEPGTPDLLTTKMVPLLRVLRAGNETMHAMVCTAGRNTAALIMRKPIGKPKRKLLSDAVDAQAGAKFFVGQCVFQDGALTFILIGSTGGLAKRLGPALLRQTGQRLKIRVRGDDGEESDGEESDVPAAQDATVSPPTGAPNEAPEPPDAERHAFRQRLEAIKPKVTTALKGMHPDATKIRAFLAFAVEKFNAPNSLQSAQQSLDALEKLLGLPGSPGATPSVPPAPPLPTSAAAPARPAAPAKAQEEDEASAFNARLTRLLTTLKEATANAHPRASDAKLKASEAGYSARKRDFAAAQALLDDLESLLKSPAPGKTPAAAPEARSDKRDARSPEASALHDRVTQVNLWLKELDKHADFARLRQGFAGAVQALRDQDLQTATRLLDEVEPAIQAARAAERNRAAKGGVGPSLRKVATASLAWRDACALARREVVAIQSGVIVELESEGEFSAAEIDAVRAELQRLNRVFDIVSPQLSDAIDAAIGLGADQRATALRRVLAMVDDASQQIEGDEMIEAARDNGVHDIDLATPALAALATLREAIEPLATA